MPGQTRPLTTKSVIQPGAVQHLYQAAPINLPPTLLWKNVRVWLRRVRGVEIFVHAEARREANSGSKSRVGLMS
jgi:DUF1365 family protein